MNTYVYVAVADTQTPVHLAYERLLKRVQLLWLNITFDVGGENVALTFSPLLDLSLLTKLMFQTTKQTVHHKRKYFRNSGL